MVEQKEKRHSAWWWWTKVMVHVMMPGRPVMNEEFGQQHDDQVTGQDNERVSGIPLGNVKPWGEEIKIKVEEYNKQNGNAKIPPEKIDMDHTVQVAYIGRK